MLEIVPFGVFKYLWRPISGYYGNIAFVTLKDLAPTYNISWKPFPGDKDIFGNRPLDHIQVHGCCMSNVGAEHVVGTQDARYVFGPNIGKVIAYPTIGRYSKTTNLTGWILPGTRETWVTRKDPDSNSRWFAFHYGCEGGFYYCTFLEILISNGTVYVTSSFCFYLLKGSTLYKASDSRYQWLDVSFSDGKNSVKIRQSLNTSVSSYGQEEDRLRANPTPVLEFYRAMCHSFKEAHKAYSGPFSYTSTRYTADASATFRPLKSSELHRLKWDVLRYYANLTSPSLPTRENLGEATQSAVDNLTYFDGNTATLVKELVNLRKALFDLHDLLQLDVDPKSLANLWLSLRFGIRLTLQDLLNLSASAFAGRRRYRRILKTRGSYTDGVWTTRCLLYSDPDNSGSFEKCMNFLQGWDIFPSLSNVWDIVPYSFVLDWFLDIDGFLSDIDTKTRYSTAEVIRCLYTSKTEWTFDKAIPGLTGQIKFTRFIRQTRKDAVMPLPHFSGSLPSVTNVIDGAALIIQRR